MKNLIVTIGDEQVVTGFRYEADGGYVTAADEVALDPATIDHRDFLPLGSKTVDDMTDPPTIEDNPAYRRPDPLDRSEVPDSLKQEYRDGAAVWEQAKADWQAAKQDADAAAADYDAAATAGEKADALDARVDALQAQEQAVANLFTDGVVPALDALFKVSTDEEP